MDWVEPNLPPFLIDPRMKPIERSMFLLNFEGFKFSQFRVARLLVSRRSDLPREFVMDDLAPSTAPVALFGLTLSAISSARSNSSTLKRAPQ